MTTPARFFTTQMTLLAPISRHVRIASTSLRGTSQFECSDQAHAQAGYANVPNPSHSSAVERAIGDARLKQFSIDELVALARGFRLPVLWFLLPPSMEEDPGLSVPDGTSQGLEFTDYLKILFGEEETERLYEDALQRTLTASTPTYSPTGNVTMRAAP